MKTQRLKVWPESFDAMFAGKTWTCRRCDDRQFSVGEVIDFIRWDPSPAAKQDPMFLRSRITGITRHAGGIELVGLVSGAGSNLVPMAILTFIPLFGGPGEPPNE